MSFRIKPNNPNWLCRLKLLYLIPIVILACPFIYLYEGFKVAGFPSKELKQAWNRNRK